MNDSKASKSKKEQKTSYREIILEPDEKEDVKDPEADKNLGLHPAELEDEINQGPERKVPEREADVKVQVKELPEPAEREEEAKPSMLTIQKSEAILQAKQAEKRCPFNQKLSCRDCRLYQPFLGTEHHRTCAIIQVSHRMPL